MPAKLLIISMLQKIIRYKTGIFVTLIFHLCALIVLMLFKISALHYAPAKAIEIAFDHEQEAVDKLQQEQQRIEQELAAEMQQAAAQSGTHSLLRNVAVNQEIPTDNELMAQNAALQQRIAATHQMMREYSNEEAALPSATPTAETKPYVGPSVLSYLLKGRQAHYLPVPVYMCEGGGKVLVLIVVAPTGNVVNAAIDKAHSSNNECLCAAALQAALRSKFNASNNQQRESGSITYQFVAQ
ncbi:hypothetical protein FACS1894156_2390 [Bacteroidia bacterium]|nr:hypothetical protein FACS1894156_2390 [Bacteroidia bacterium]